MLDTLQWMWDGVRSIPHVGWMLAFGWFVYLVLLGVWIVLQKREPVATLSWLLGLAFLPYLGFVIYVVFGPQRIKRNRLRRSRSRMVFEGALFQESEDAIELGRLAQSATHLAPSTARDVRLLIDGACKYDALIEDIGRAEHHVHLEYYIYQPDRTGAELRDALVGAARRGVRVRVLVDAIGSGKASDEFFAPLLAAGGEVLRFHPARLWRFWRVLSRPLLNLRTHRKIAVVDGRFGYTGGINITDDENDRLRDDAYRDLHLRIEGDVVRSLQLVFAEDWAYAGGSSLIVSEIANAEPPSEPGPIAAQTLVSGPDSPWEAIHRLHVSAIHAAHDRVWLVTPYFVPGEAAMMALTSAALGGLDVRLAVPRMSDSLMVTLAARSYYDDLLAAGVKIYEYGPRMLHTKALLVDEDLALIGTANFDHRSFRLNFEVAVLFHDAAIAGQLATLIEGDLAHAPEVDRERHQPLFGARLPEALARLLSPLL